jgi:hypothetical protein
MKTKIKLDLEFGLCNGSMTLEIFQNNLLIEKLENVTDVSKNVYIIVELPCQIKFVLSNKNYNTDTVVDNTGSIVNDKYVILKNMVVETIPVKIDILFNICRYYKNHLTPPVNDTYWGFNGNAVIDFDAKNFIEWCLKHNNIFDF